MECHTCSIVVGWSERMRPQITLRYFVRRLGRFPDWIERLKNGLVGLSVWRTSLAWATTEK